MAAAAVAMVFELWFVTSQTERSPLVLPPILPRNANPGFVLEAHPTGPCYFPD